MKDKYTPVEHKIEIKVVKVNGKIVDVIEESKPRGLDRADMKEVYKTLKRRVNSGGLLNTRLNSYKTHEEVIRETIINPLTDDHINRMKNYVSNPIVSPVGDYSKKAKGKKKGKK